MGKRLASKVSSLGFRYGSLKIIGKKANRKHEPVNCAVVKVFFCASLSNQMSLSFSKCSTMTEDAQTHNGAQPYLKTPRDLLKDGGVEFLGAKIRIFSKAKIR